MTAGRNRIAGIGAGALLAMALASAGPVDPAEATGVVDETVTFDARPTAIVTGADGDLWIAFNEIDAVRRIDPDTNTVLTTVTVQNEPTDLAVGVDGDIWVANNVGVPGEGNSISRIDVGTNVVVATIPSGRTPQALAVTPDGDLWSANRDDTISRIDDATNTIIGSYPTTVDFPMDVVLALDGDLWITDGDGDKVVRFDPATATKISQVAVGDSPDGILQPADSSFLWVANRGSDTLSRIHTGVGSVTSHQVGNYPQALAEDQDGDIWIARDDVGGVARFDPSTQAVTEGVQTGQWPYDVSVGADGDVWVLNRNGSSASRIQHQSTVTGTFTIGDASLTTGQQTNLNVRLKDDDSHDAAHDVQATFELPTILSFVSSSSGCTAADQVVTCPELASLAPGQTQVWTTVVQGVGFNSGTVEGEVTWSHPLAPATSPATFTSGTITSGPGPQPPGQPVLLAAELGPDGIELTWDAPAISSTPITAYTVYRDGDDIGSVTGAPPATSFTDDEPDPGASHTYTVSATNSAGEGLQSDPADIDVPDPPGAPTDLDRGVGEGVAVLWWGPAESTDEVQAYEVWRDDALVAELQPRPFNRWSDGDATPGATHDYEVRAVDVDDEAGPAAEIDLLIPTVATFSDASLDHPFSKDVEWMAASEVSTGYDDDTFRPSAVVTRQAMSAFMYRLAGSPASVPPTTPSFADVGIGHPFFAEVEWMAGAGVSTGYEEDDTYRPSLPVTRQAMSAFMYRLAGSPPSTPPGEPTFTDVGTSHPFRDEVEWMADAEVSTGYEDGTYRPAAPVTRQAMAAFMHRLDLLLHPLLSGP
jgi:DNA-binding beta-propeller fold protein YncE